MALSRNKRIIYGSAIYLVLIIILWNFIPKMLLKNDDTVYLQLNMGAEQDIPIQVFYSDTMEFSEDKSEHNSIDSLVSNEKYYFPISSNTNFVRIDLAESEGKSRCYYSCIHVGSMIIPFNIPEQIVLTNDIDSITQNDHEIEIKSNGDDPYLAIDLSNINIKARFDEFSKIKSITYHAVIIFAILMIIIVGVMEELQHNSISKADPKSLSCLQIAFLLITIAILVAGALLISTIYCPDEIGRQYVTDFIFAHSKLPTGYEYDVMIKNWGFSYAFRPFVTSIINAGFMKIASCITSSAIILQLMARMSSVLAVTGTFYFCLKSGNEVFNNKGSALFMAVFTCFIPQVMFLGMYMNNDAVTLFFVSMELYALIKCIKYHFMNRDVITFGVSISIGLLSYYDAYMWILIGSVAYIYALFTDTAYVGRTRLKIEKCVAVILIILVLAGWFFIRNIILHDGDVFGMASEKLMRSLLENQGWKFVSFKPGSDSASNIVSLLFDNNADFLSNTCKSFVGKFGHMSIELSNIQYHVYGILFCAGIICFLWRLRFISKTRVFIILSMVEVVAGLLTIVLFIYQSYYRDYQPQGRYIISLAIVFGMAFSLALDSFTEKKKFLGIIASFLWIGMFCYAWASSMTKMVM